MQIPLIGHKLHNHQIETDCNFYIETEQRGGESTICMYGTPGLRTWFDSGAQQAVRGMLDIPDQNLLFAVCGATLYEIDTGGNGTSRGTLGTASGAVYLVNNGLQLCIVDGAGGYVLTYSGNTFAPISDVDFPGASTLDYQDGYGIINDPDTGNFYLSGLYDFTAWSALDYASAEGWPDNIKRVLCDHREAWLFGTQTTEPWYNSGGSPFPFDRISGAYIEYGIGAPASAAKADNTIFWLTDKGLVARANGYQPQIVSTRLVEHQIQRYSRIDDAIGFTYIESGHVFYVLTFPAANRTWVYDVTMNFWHAWSSWPYMVDEIPCTGRHRANCYAWFDRKHLVGDFQTGIIYEMSHDFLDDAGESIRGQLTLPPVGDGRNWVFYSNLELHMKTGVGAEVLEPTSEQPQVALQISEDGGYTWGPELWRSIGHIGQTGLVVRWPRLGRSKSRMFRFIFTDAVERVIYAVYVDVAKGI